MLLQAPITTLDPSVPLAGEDFILMGVKLMFIIAAILYVVFAFVVVRQISVMKGTLVTSFSPVIQLLGFAHLLLAIGVLLFFILVL